MNGRTFAGGDVLRCRLSGLEGSGDAERQRFFGAGAHVCLGRALSMDLFAALADHLGGLSTKVNILDCAMRDCDVFAVPERMIIGVSA